jgi:hypothetical protein
MKWSEIIKNEFSAMALVLVLFGAPFLALLGYTKMNVETSLLRRELRAITYERDHLFKRNNAIKDELLNLSNSQNIENIYWKKYGFLPFYVRNKVVSVELNSGDE